MAAQVVEDVAEQGFAVGVADGFVEARFGAEASELAVVGEDPVSAPEFADKRMGVGQADFADVGLADVADGDFAFDGVGLDHFGDAGVGAGVGVVEAAHALAFVERHAPAVFVGTGVAAAAGQAGEAEAQVGGGVGAHGQQFAHGKAILG